MKYRIDLKQSIVHEDKISITLLGLLSKFSYVGHVAYLDVSNERMFLPARSGGWRWHVDGRDFGIHTAALKLCSGEQSRSCVSVRYDGTDPAPHPLQFSLSCPDFLGNFLAVAVSDEGEREKSFMQPLTEPMAVGAHTVTVVGADAGGVEVEISR